MRTIAIPMDRDLLKNTKNVVPALDPPCSDIEGETIKELDDVTLSRSIAGLVLRTMISEIESTRRKEKRKEVFERLRRKYVVYPDKYWKFFRQFGEGENLKALRDELKEKDDELVIVIEKCSVLEGTLRSREEELEVRRIVEAQCGDLQTQVIELYRQLKECQLQVEVLIGEIAEKVGELEKAEAAWSEALNKAESLEVVIPTKMGVLLI